MSVTREQACWNLAVRCCGPECDLPWALDIGHGDADGGRYLRRGEITKLGARNIQNGDQALDDGWSVHEDADVHERRELLELAPAFFRVSVRTTAVRGAVGKTVENVQMKLMPEQLTEVGVLMRHILQTLRYKLASPSRSESTTSAVKSVHFVLKSLSL